jgi:flagellar assembly factor FliW
MTTNAALALPIEYVSAPTTVTIHSDLLGPLTVPAQDLVAFPVGLFGFPECRSFALVAAERDGMYWLQSADYGTLAFLLIDPFRFVEGYAVDLAATDLAELEATEPADVAVLAIVTLPATRAELPTVNLQGPVAFNLRLRRGKQLAISDGEWGLRHEVDLSRPAAPL